MAKIYIPERIPLFDSIADYNRQIRIPDPLYSDVDVRDFAENMKQVRLNMPPFRIPFFQIAILQSGGGTVSSDGKAYELAERSLFFQLPGQIIYWDVPQNWQGYYISLAESFYSVQLDGFSRLYDFPFFKNYTPAISLPDAAADRILSCFQHLHADYREVRPKGELLLKSELATLLALCLREYKRAVDQSRDADRQASLTLRFQNLVHRQLQSMVLNLSEDSLSVSRCADQLFVTPKHLSETVSHDLGMPPSEFIQRALVAEAQKLMRSTDWPVKEIAHLLGFQDASYFGRLFKKISGQSPSAFMKQQG